jgi:hypothetical protein
MTTYTPFVPNAKAPFQFSAVLDGVTYAVSVPWSLFGRRYYVTVYDESQTLLFALPLIGSPAALPIQNIEWFNRLVTVTTVEDHPFAPGTVADLMIKGQTPSVYSGLRRCEIINVTQFTYSLTTYPGSASVFGQVSHDVNIAEGYVRSSSLVFRDGSQTFEVDP